MNTLTEDSGIETRRHPGGDDESFAQTLPGLESSGGRNSVKAADGLSNTIYRSWACRKILSASDLDLEESPTAPPVPGDAALVRVNELGFHKHLTTAENRRLRLYPGVQLVGVFGNRYASDAFEAEVEGTGSISLLTGAGMIGTVKSKYGNMCDATPLTFLGFARGANGRRLNMKEQLFRPVAPQPAPANLIYIIGTSMNSGKTTTCTRLIRALSDLGLKVAACKLTGSVSNHDPDELSAAAALKVTDFSDFGFASTYLASKQELLQLFHTMLAEVAVVSPDVVLMELADGLVQRETAMLLKDPEIKQAAKGVVLSAGGSLSALWSTDYLKQMGYRIIAVSGKFTSSPLAIREYVQNDSNTPVASSLNMHDGSTGMALGEMVSRFLGNDRQMMGNE